MGTGHLKWFDAARGIAAIAVLLDHSYYIFIGTPGFTSSALTLAGEFAVYFFFSMSGFLITLSIENNIARNSSFNIFNYALSRVLRIYPPLIGAIAVVVLVGVAIRVFGLPDLNLAGREKYVFDYREIITALEMRRGLGISNGSLWSLYYIEGQIYLIVGGVSALIWSKRAIPMALGGIATALGVYCAKDIPFFLFCAAIWTIGSLAYLVIGRSFETQIAPPKWLNATGDFSYSLYVVHFPLLLLAASLSKQAHLSGVWLNGAMAASAVFIIGFAYLFSLVFERPHQFKAFFASRLIQTGPT